jgi:hypothetical protein
VGIILADVRVRQHVIPEIDDIRSGAAVVLLAEVESSRIESLDELADARRVSTAKLIDTLLGISESNQPAVLPERRVHPPFVQIGVLKFVENNHRIAVGEDAAEARALLQQIGGQPRKKVEA